MKVQIHCAAKSKLLDATSVLFVQYFLNCIPKNSVLYSIKLVFVHVQCIKKCFLCKHTFRFVNNNCCGEKQVIVCVSGKCVSDCLSFEKNPTGVTLSDVNLSCCWIEVDANMY